MNLAHKGGEVGSPRNQAESGTHTVSQEDGARRPRHGFGALLRGKTQPAPVANVPPTLYTECDGCGCVIEVELSRFLDSPSVDCSACEGTRLSFTGAELDRPTVSFTPSPDLLRAAIPPRR